ncbi:MAG: hypothetical protein SFU55_11240 [Methylophilus sp.]|nr:hypothetical protein [Methylophilus sp.]
MNKIVNPKSLLIAAALAFFMLLTRGSHMLTPFSLPDASIVLFLLGGLWLKRAGWFAAFFVLATCIDFGAAAFDPAQGFCLTNGYWGLIPSYGVMWLGGIWLSKQDDAFSPLPYALVAVSTAFAAFVISTQTYYLFSGRFPAQGLVESMKHGWEYLPSWMGYASAYFAIVWLAVYALRSLTVLKTAKE